MPDDPDSARTHPAAPPAPATETFEIVELLGRGGMGEVVLATDPSLLREVAIKRITGGAPSDDAILRFVREARVQAGLEHPAIVPVHGLFYDARGYPYFTMKRVTGITLLQVMEMGTTQTRLLRALVDVTLAIDFAHSRGVIHRDLKPANIMLGAFGEVYVLDWGLAKLEHGHLVETADPGTLQGALLGTPGYMSPEQIQHAVAVDRPTDIYALGAILFELLTGAPLHPRDAAIESTFMAASASPRERRPDLSIAPELDALCIEMCRKDPTARPTARAVVERLQQYLDGDRDLTLRAELAQVELNRARDRLANGEADDAMRAAGRALALDPTSPAAEIVSRLMLEPPTVMPAGLRAELIADERQRRQARVRLAIAAYVGFVAFIPLTLWNGITNWSAPAVTLAAAVGLLGFAIAIRRANQVSDSIMWVYAAANFAFIGCVTQLFGPFLLTPGVACVTAASLASYPTFSSRRWLIAIGAAVAWSTPVVLELVGGIARSWAIEDAGLVLQSSSFVFDRTIVLALLFGAPLAIVASTILTNNLARANLASGRELLRQRWQLSRLLPDAR